jgi:hypothetical protein
MPRRPTIHIDGWVDARELGGEFAKGSCDSLYFALTLYVLLLWRNDIQKKYSECEFWVISYSLQHKESVGAQIKL